MKIYNIYFADEFEPCDVERFRFMLNKIYPSLEAKILSPLKDNEQHYLFVRTSSNEIINSIKELAINKKMEIKEIKTNF